MLSKSFGLKLSIEGLPRVRTFSLVSRLDQWLSELCVRSTLRSSSSTGFRCILQTNRRTVNPVLKFRGRSLIVPGR